MCHSNGYDDAVLGERHAREKAVSGKYSGNVQHNLF